MLAFISIDPGGNQGLTATLAEPFLPIQLFLILVDIAGVRGEGSVG